MSGTQTTAAASAKGKNAAVSSAATKSASPTDDSAKAQTPTTPPPKPKTPAKFIMHGVRIFDAIAVVMALNVIVIARFLRPGFWSTLMYTAVGLPIGVAMSFLYFKRYKEKRTRRQLVRSLACPGSSAVYSCTFPPESGGHSLRATLDHRLLTCSITLSQEQKVSPSCCRKFLRG